MKMVLIGGGALVLGAALLVTPQQSASSIDLAPIVRRLAATAHLAAQEYRVGIVDGRVVSPAEVSEARLFLQESRRSAAALPAAISHIAVTQIDSIILLVDRTGAPDSVDAKVRRLTGGIASELGVTLDDIPRQ